MSDETEVETIRISPRAAWNKMRELTAENANLKKEVEAQLRTVSIKNSTIKGLYTELETHRWIPVEERLPESLSINVWVTDGKTAWICWYVPSTQRWAVVKSVLTTITHWKPILLPKGITP